MTNSPEKNSSLPKRHVDRGVSADTMPDVLYGRSLASIYKEHLPYLAKSYSVVPYEEVHEPCEPSEMVASFDVTKLVVESGGMSLEKLKNVYHMLAYSGERVALLVHRSTRECRVSLAVGVCDANSERAVHSTREVCNALLGNFPGSQCTPITHFSDAPDAAFGFLNKSLGFGSASFNSMGIVTNVASDFSERFAAQGIERLVDGVQLKEGEQYTIALVAKAVDSEEIERRKVALFDLYTALSPFARVQRSWGEQSSTTWTKSFNLNLFGSMPIGGAPATPAPMLGGGIGVAVSKGTTTGKSQTDTVTITEFGVEHTLETIKDHVKRIEECEALGLWQFAAYVVSPSYRIVNEVCHAYLSLTQGSASHLERPSVNVWNAHDAASGSRDEIEKMCEYLRHLDHPLFEKDVATKSRVFNHQNWPAKTYCVADIAGSELTKALNLPSRSIPGLPVIECAAFGRDVSSYDPMLQGEIRLGKIHHMHGDEQRFVDLTADSLASHVFVTGSTGSGKSNAVYRLLDEAHVNFLVIEPAKGEYRFAFSDDVNYFGTNFMMGDLLRVNPFEFPDGIHVYEHIDRLLEVFNVCWPMYAAMSAVLKSAVIRAYEKVGWDLVGSRNDYGRLFPTFADVCSEVDNVIVASDYSDENKGNYRGALKTRLLSLTNGINGSIFCGGGIPDSVLFDSKTIIDLSRVGSTENKSLIMGILVIKLQEHRMCSRVGSGNEGLKHITVLEEAHNLLRKVSASSSPELGGGVEAKSVEMLANSIAEMRTYGEGFVIVDQGPGLLDMSVIRNTNTKVILRLPDQGDRELVGRAANLNDAQIAELARLQRGVAAVYQNEWIEPVLCHVALHELTANRSGAEFGAKRAAGERRLEKPREGLAEEELRYVNSCVYDPFHLDDPTDIRFTDCVMKLDVPDSLKSLMIEYARTSHVGRKKLYGEVAFAYFEVDELLRHFEGDTCEGDWDGLLADYVQDKRAFADDVELGLESKAWKRFSSRMLAESADWVQRNGLNPERDTMLAYLCQLGGVC